MPSFLTSSFALEILKMASNGTFMRGDFDNELKCARRRRAKDGHVSSPNALEVNWPKKLRNGLRFAQLLKRTRLRSFVKVKDMTDILFLQSQSPSLATPFGKRVAKNRKKRNLANCFRLLHTWTSTLRLWTNRRLFELCSKICRNLVDSCGKLGA